MGNSQGKGKAPKNDKKVVAAALASSNTPGAELYSLALNERDLETKEELLTRAGKVYIEEGYHAAAALAFSNAADVSGQLKEWGNATDSALNSMMEYSLFGAKHFNKFQDVIDKAVYFSKRSESKVRPKATQDKIGQAILRMMTSCETGEVITLLIKSQMVAVYLKGDYFSNGLKIMIDRFKEGDATKSYGVWAMVFQSATEFFVSQFALDGSLDDNMATFAVAAILCANIYQWELKTGDVKPDAPKDKEPKKDTGDQDESKSDNEGSGSEEDERNTELVFPTPQQLMQKFMFINAYKRSAHQFVHNILCAAEAGDLEALDDQFREIYVVRRKNTNKLVEYLCDNVYKEKFEKWIEQGKIPAGTWTETPAMEAESTSGNATPAHDPVADLL